MSLVPTVGQSIIVDTPSGAPTGTRPIQSSGLTSWLSGRAEQWERFRTRGYSHRWGEYWRLWRGRWNVEDKNRKSERSRLVAPALANAIEMSVAEVEEAFFSKEVWFDIVDDIADEEKLDAMISRDNLLEDLEQVNAKSAISEAALNAALFGTGVIKMNVEVVLESTPSRDGATQKLSAQEDERVRIFWESIRPDEFIPDPAGRNIPEMLGCFHKIKKPVHAVLEKIEKGVYLESALPFVGGQFQAPRDGPVDTEDPQHRLLQGDSDEVEILEYHGKVPANLLAAATNPQEQGNESELVSIIPQNPLDSMLNATVKDGTDGPMVEAIVTIANNSVLLRAIVNPFTMKDRSVLAFAYEKVPGRFWGRGVAEKGFNPQKALDAELRARIDALGFVSSPMLGVDGGRVPRGFKLEVKPGKVWLTQGPPKEVLQPIGIGEIQANTFNQTQEMERMVQLGTGAFDTASQIRSQGSQSNGPSAQNLSLSMGAFVKRAKRAVRNMNDNLIAPLVKATMWRYMQFDPVRYPQDTNFVVKATMGIVAREVEAMQLTQLIGMLPDEYPEISGTIAKGIVDLSSIHNKAEITQAMDAALAPPTEEEQQEQAELKQMQKTSLKADTQQKLLINQKTMAETRKLLGEALVAQRQADQSDIKTQVEVERLKNEIEQLDILRDQNRIALERVRIEEQRVENEKARLAQGNT